MNPPSYYWDGTQWQVIQMSSMYVPDAYQLGLSVWSHDGVSNNSDVKIAFDNFVLISGTVEPCP